MFMQDLRDALTVADVEMAERHLSGPIGIGKRGSCKISTDDGDLARHQFLADGRADEAAGAGDENDRARRSIPRHACPA
ncbi:hypothetical protein D3C87_1990160 [compost metagenome]